MSNAVKAIVLSTFLAAGAALAADDAATTSSSDAAASVMRPGNIDVRGMIDTDILLVYVNLGAMAEVGLLPIGPGTLAVGGEVDYGFCGSLCLVISAASAIDIGERYFTPMARVSYHFPIEAVKVASKIDFYGALSAGVTFASLGISADDNSFRVEGADTAFAVAPGVGANWFVNEHFYVGGEGRLRYTQGTYRVTASSGAYAVTAEDEAWSLTGFNLNFFAGYRF